jgi:dolichol-phosphate mannosyltransferase
MRYSFVVPIYQDAALAEAFCSEFERVMGEYVGAASLIDQAELIFVNDGSPDPANSATLEAVAARFGFVRIIELSRNFGQHIALTAGYEHARGDYVGMLNVDMEDPPDQIPLLLDEIRKGHAGMVYGLRAERRSPWHMRLTSVMFHWVMTRLTGWDMPPNVSTLRVMTRQFVDEYNRLSEKSRYLPGLEGWLGFRKAFVPIRHQPRKQGRSAYTFFSRLMMAGSALISFSDLPLRVMVLIGTALAVLGFALTAVLVFGKLFSIAMQPGYTSTISLILLLGGVQIVAIGLASLYIGRILREVQNRPVYIVRRRFNCAAPNGQNG